MARPRHASSRSAGLAMWRRAHALTFGAMQGSYTRWVRIVRMGKYGSYSIAALVSYHTPSILVSTAFTPGGWTAFAYVWSTVLLLGALVSFLGVATRTWVGEFIGLWGVIIALAMYSITAFTIEVTGNRVVLGFLALGFTMSAVARRQDVALSKRIAEYNQRVASGRQGL